MTKLPDDVVREIERVAQDFIRLEEHTEHFNLLWAARFKQGAEFGYQLSQAKAMKLVEAIERTIELHKPLPGELTEYGEGANACLEMVNDDLKRHIATFKQETTPREDEK